MPKKSIQSTLDEGPLEVRETTGILLAKILNWNPRLSIRLQVRGRSYRPQVRFWCQNEETATWVVRILGLTTKIELHTKKWFRVMITSRKVVQEVLGVLLPHLAGYTYERAELLLEALGILDGITRLQWSNFPPARLTEIVEVLE